MIVFDLQCHNGHTFEGWFDDLESFEKQAGQGLVSCPVCEDVNVVRVPSTFGIKSSAPKQLQTPQSGINEAAFLRKMAEFVEKNFDDVGSRFTDEALKIHYGATEPRNIRGTSTKAQEELLQKEGVSFVKFPAPVIEDPDA